MAIPHYLMACYLYYHLDQPLLSDETFDGCLVRTLDERRGSLSHPHRDLVPWDMLKTGFDIEYPLSVKYAALALSAAFGRPLEADLV